MIVCSQTCFLNVLTQMYKKEVLINASYYIADLSGPGGISHLNPDNIASQMMYMEEASYKYNEDGQLVKTGSPIVSVDRMQKYHVTYTRGSLNPTSTLTTLKMGPETRALSPELRYVHALQNTDVAIEVYHDLFYSKPRGNGLQVLIYSNDNICCKFGWITCEYLSSCFGADIIFLDAKYRKKIAPQSKFEYNGNKQFAATVFIPRIRDEELVKSIFDNMTRSNLTECTNNITTKLSVMNEYQLRHLYQLLWPMDPLPQINYPADQLREIILYKCVGNRKPTAFDKLNNLYAADAFYQMANEYDL